MDVSDGGSRIKVGAGVSACNASLMLSAVLAVATMIRFSRLTERSIWFDEAFSWSLATQFSWMDMVERTARDVHPPLYYCLLRLWVDVLGSSVLALRGFSVLLADVAIIGLYLFCRDALSDASRSESSLRISRLAGIFSASLLSVGATHIRWSHETRMYTLATALAVFSSWMLVRALRAETHPGRWWGAYSLLAAAFLLTHNYALFTVFAQGVCVLGRFLLNCLFGEPAARRWSVFRSALGAYAAVLWMYAPWVPALLYQKRQVQNEYWISGIDWWTVPDAVNLLFIPKNDYQVETHFDSALLCAGIALCLIMAAVGRSPGRWLLIGLTTVPVACATIISVVSVSVIVDRHLLFAYLFLLCIIGMLVARLRSGLVQGIVMTVLVADSLVVHHWFQDDLQIAHRPGTRGAVKEFLRVRSNDEPLIVAHPCVYFNAKYYLQEIAPTYLFLGGSVPQHYAGGPILALRDVISPKDLKSLACDRIWVLDTTGFTAGFARPTIPSVWKYVPGSRRSYRDVLFFQGEVFIDAYEKKDSNEVARVREVTP